MDGFQMDYLLADNTTKAMTATLSWHTPKCKVHKP